MKNDANTNLHATLKVAFSRHAESFLHCARSGNAARSKLELTASETASRAMAPMAINIPQTCGHLKLLHHERGGPMG